MPLEEIKPSVKKLEVQNPQEALKQKHAKNKKIETAKAKVKLSFLKKDIKPEVKDKPKESYYKLSDADRKKLQKALGFKFEKRTTDEEIRQAIGSKRIEDFIKGEKTEKCTIGRIFAKRIEMKDGKKVESNMKFGENLNVGDEVFVDLTTNKEAYDRLGMKAFFAHQPEIRRVRLTQFGEGRSGLAERGPDDNFYFVNESTGIRSDVYAPIYKTAIKIEQKWNAAEKKTKLPKGYKPDWAHMDYLKKDDNDYIPPWRDYAGPIPSKSIKYSQEIIGNTPKAELAKKGITPFIVRMGYRLTPEEAAIYNAMQKDSYKIGKLSFQKRAEVLQERYKLKDAWDLSFNALNLKEENRLFFYAYNDAVLKIESNYNPIGVNRRRGRIAYSTASGAYQILNSVWESTCNKWFRDTKKSRYYRRWYSRLAKGDRQINWKMLDKVDFSEQLPGQATPYKHAIFHNIYAFKGSRVYKGSMAFDEVFALLRSKTLPEHMDYSYKAYLYANWRNGHGGAKFLLRNIREGIPYPRTKEEARNYFDNHLRDSDWQKRRGFNDFYTLVRACRTFVGRFNKNLSELGAA